MKLFLSYPSAERHLAERLALALEAEGHEVFFDRSDLAPGQAFHQRLREAIAAADAMVFLVTPAAVAAGSYTLAELDIARERWRRPAGHVLPVMVAPTPIATLPPYLSAVTLLQPQGELVAATVAAVARLGRRGGGRRWAVVGGVTVLLLGAAALMAMQVAQRRESALALQRDQAAAAQAVQLCADGSHEAALQQLVALAATQPAAPGAAAQRDDCAMRWIRDMRAVRSGSSERTFEQQVAVVQPVLLQGLAAASGQRAADLRAHLGWGEYLRGREGVNGGDPVPHWQRALTEDRQNVYAHAMWANILLPRNLAQARQHFNAAVASGREREFVRRMQFGGALGGSDELAAYAVVVADEMRLAGEAIPAATSRRLWNFAFGSRLLDVDVRQALFAALPPPALLATFVWLFPAARDPANAGPLERFNLGLLQAHAGDADGARTTLETLQRRLRAEGQSGRLAEQTRSTLAALPPLDTRRAPSPAAPRR